MSSRNLIREITALRLFTVLIIGFFLENMFFYIRDGEYRGLSFNTFLELIGALTAVSALILLYNKRGLQWSDYKIRVMGFGLFLTIFGFYVGQIWYKENIFNINRYEAGEYVLVLIELLIIPVMIFALAIRLLLNTADPFASEIKTLNFQVMEGNYDYKISKPQIMTDSLFGPMTFMLNSITSTTAALLNTIKEESEHISSSSEELSANVEEINAASEEVSEISKSLSRGASEQAEKTQLVYQNLNQLRDMLETVTTDITKNTNAVSQISLQTNILALNAGIEASRAGDYGRGFAVVAENVRKLSDETRSLADQISETANSLADLVSTHLDRNRLLIEDVAAVSEETASSSEEVTASVEEVSANIQQIADLIVELSRRSANNMDFLGTINT